jgi:hypothetical protein
MDQACFVKQAQSIEQLLCENPDQGRAQAPELILLYQLVQVDTE